MKPLLFAIMAIEPREQLAELSATLQTVESVMDLPKMREELIKVEAEASVPNLWDDPAHAQTVTSRLSFLQSELKKVVALRQRIDDAEVLLDLAESESDADSHAEVDKELTELKHLVSEIEVRTLLNGEFDAREALITIRSEAGGVDAADWAQMLMRMYLRYCERHNWPTDVYETT